MGNVPGAIGSVVKVRDAVKKIERQVYDLQYPTFVPTEENVKAKKMEYEGASLDPWLNDYHENDVVSGVDQDDD